MAKKKEVKETMVHKILNTKLKIEWHITKNRWCSHVLWRG